MGHWAQHCRGKLKVDAEAHAAQDDEPTLMFACGPVEGEQRPLTSILPIHPLPALPDSDDDLDPPSPLRIELVEAKVLAVLGAPGAQDLKRWVLDTGATNHMTGCRVAFSDLNTGIVGSVRFGDGSVVAIEGRGTVLFACKNGEHQVLANTYYIPRLTTNIVSVGQLDETGFQVLVADGVMRIRDEERRLVAKVPRNPSRLYILDADVVQPVCWAAHAREDAWLWHARFGHVNFRALRKMGREELVRGMPVLEQPEQVCDACLAGKCRRTPFPQCALARSSEVLQLLHGDLCGPISLPTPVDDHSRYMWITLLPSQDAAAAAIKRTQAAAERKTGKKVLSLRTDRGGVPGRTI